MGQCLGAAGAQHLAELKAPLGDIKTWLESDHSGLMVADLSGSLFAGILLKAQDKLLGKGTTNEWHAVSPRVFGTAVVCPLICHPQMSSIT